MANKLRDLRKPGWFWARNELIERDGAKLGAYGIAVYCVLAKFAGDKNHAWPSVNRIANTLGCSPNTVRKALDALTELGWISKKQRAEKDEDGNVIRYHSNVYYLHDGGTASGEQPHASGEQGGSAGDGEEEDSSFEEESVVPAAANCFVFYEQNIGPLTPYILDTFNDYLEDDNCTEEWIIDAITEAVEANVRKLSYIKRILNSWIAEGRNMRRVRANHLRLVKDGDGNEPPPQYKRILT